MTNEEFVVMMGGAVPRISVHPHMTKAAVVAWEAENPNGADSWDAFKNPHVWELLEYSQGVQVFLDSGYGKMAVVYRDQLVECTSNNVIMTAEFVVLNKGVFGIPKCVWR